MSIITSNPIISDVSMPTMISFAQTRDTLMDTETYSRFIHSCENNFKSSRFYKAYKSNVMNKGLYMDQTMPSINSEMVDLELHHHFPRLKYATIMITEHILNTKGCVTTFEVVKELEEAHRNNWMGILILTKTQHQVYHSDPSSFISLSQCYGDPFKFLDKYIDGMTLDISFNMLLQFKLEYQYNLKSFTPNMAKARDTIISWQNNVKF